MNEQDLRGLIGRVKAGRLSRRGFIQKMMAVGLTAPMATQLLAHAGVAMAQSRPVYKPTKRGGGGLLKVLWWQAPTLLNPHFATGTKDQDGSRIFYEPLAGWDGNGNLRPCLAVSIPGREDGTLAADGKSVIWKIKPGVTWHDGRPLTADDVVFTTEFATNPAGAKWDAQMANEGKEINANWDGIWDVRTRVVDDGWVAEIRIPFRTLKFSSADVQTWGINFKRKIRRLNEDTYWAPVPRIYGLERASPAVERARRGQVDLGRGAGRG